MSAPGKSGNKYRHTNQERDNSSHDDVWGVNVVEIVGENEAGTALTRLTIGSDGTPGGSATSATSTGVTVGSTSTTILASNTSRKSAVIVNDSDETIYLKLGSGATSNSGIRINANGGSATITKYTGIITGICASGSKVAVVTEL